MLAKPPMDSYMETWVPLCGTVCVSQSPYFWSHTLIKMCTCISTCIQVHLTPEVLHPLCIVTQKHGCSCMALCMCPSHLISGPTPSLECVHSSVHVLMSTWVPNSCAPPLHSYMETWVPMCDTVCM